MNKNITKLIAIATIVLIPVVSFAWSEPTSDTSPINSPAPISQPTAGTVPPTGNPTAGVTNPAGQPTTGTTPSTGSPTAGTAPSTGSPTAGTSAPTPTPTPTPTPNNSSGSSSGGRSVGYVYGCPMITSFMKYGVNNDTVQVTKLQNFLKNVEKIDVDVNGTFDKKTEDAVKEFQTKYSATTMGPWGATKGTGFVYITTLKQINKIACNQPLTLSASELTIINAKKNAQIATSQSVTITPKETPASVEIEVGKTENNTITFESETETEDNVATVGKASIMSRFWNFMVYLFK